MQWYLESVAEAGRQWLVNIVSTPFVIGRADDCNLRLVDDRVSRHHGEIRISGDLLWIRDLQSTNGTYVNQNKIDQARLLDPDDTISVGKYQFTVRSFNRSNSATAHETLHATFTEELGGVDLPSLESNLRELIDRRHVIPYFQPLLRFSDMTTVGYEILGRITDESLPSNPAELLDLAECLGHASELSSLFRETGVKLGKNLPGCPLLFVNSTKFEIHEMDKLLASMKKIGEMTPAETVVLEINEKAAADTADLPALRDALREMHMGLAFDDFGVGQTRLVELSNSPPDYLKFDGSLIHKIHLAPKRLHQMISTFIKAAHDLGIRTLAEGIECPEESEICQQLGFDLGQGYFFGRPAPVEAIAAI
jgi:EAL domain-containing protein (putative c-di-GMP-specific phosphodiesterase class I)